MGTRRVAFVLASLLCGGVAHAGPKEDIAAKTKEAYENYDGMDYAAAKKSLDQALVIAKKNKLDKDPLVAKVYIALGIAAHANSDWDSAKLAFLSAVQIDPKIQIEAAYKSPEVTKMLEEARKEGAGGGDIVVDPGTGSVTDAVDCAEVKGLQHTILDTAKIGVAQPIEAYLAADVAAVKVSAMYRPEGATDFTEVKLSKSEGCKYTGSIPGSAMKGALVHYYVAAYDNNNKPIAGATKGSSGSPNIMELSMPAAGGPKDGEDPIGGGGGNVGGEIGSGTITGGKPAKISLGVTVGTGFGYVSGITEANNDVKNPGIANSLLVITPELAFHATPQLSIGIAARLGVPIGANIQDHATLAPAAMARVRYALSASGEGVRVMGQVGGGIIRNTLKVDAQDPNMDTDIVAQGPLLLGGGIGYMKKLGGTMMFVADFSILGAVAVVSELGSAPALNSGVTADISLGLAAGF